MHLLQVFSFISSSCITDIQNISLVMLIKPGLFSEPNFIKMIVLLFFYEYLQDLKPKLKFLLQVKILYQSLSFLSNFSAMLEFLSPIH